MIAPWLLYATLLAALFGCAALGLQRIAQLRQWPMRWMWCGAIVASIVAPIVADLMAAPAMPAYATGPGALAVAPSISLNTVLLLVWGTASVILIVRVFTAAHALRRARRNWRPGAINGTPVLISTDVGPAIVGLTHPTPVIPAWALDLTEHERALILLHESEHSRAGDPRVLALGTASIAAMPWNPVLWWLVRRLRLAVEMDCDARVLRTAADPRAYASLLLAVGERMSKTPFAWATALAEPRSLLERRIVAMLSPKLSRRPVLVIGGLTLVAGIALAIACSTPLPDQVLPIPGAAGKASGAEDAPGIKSKDGKEAGTHAAAYTYDSVTVFVDRPAHSGDTVGTFVLKDGNVRHTTWIYRDDPDHSRLLDDTVRTREEPSTRRP